MRLHQWLLLLYPKSFRNEYGDELRRVFTRRRRDTQGVFGIATLWAGEIADTLANAGRTHADIIFQDLRYTGRALRRAPGFFAAAVVVTALGIGATTAAFTLTDHVLLRPLPFAEPDRLVKIWQSETDRPASQRGLPGTNDVAPANYRDWKAMSSAFAGMGAYSTAASNLVGAGEPERLSGANLTSDVLGRHRRRAGLRSRPPRIGRSSGRRVCGAHRRRVLAPEVGRGPVHPRPEDRARRRAMRRRRRDAARVRFPVPGRRVLAADPVRARCLRRSQQHLPAGDREAQTRTHARAGRRRPRARLRHAGPDVSQGQRDGRVRRDAASGRDQRPGAPAAVRPRRGRCLRAAHRLHEPREPAAHPGDRARA